MLISPGVAENAQFKLRRADSMRITAFSPTRLTLMGLGNRFCERKGSDVNFFRLDWMDSRCASAPLLPQGFDGGLPCNSSHPVVCC